MNTKPIACCEANDVEAYVYPFYIKPERGMEPAYIFLEDHVYNFNTDEIKEIKTHLIRINNEEDLQRLGYKQNSEGVYIISPIEKPWLQGGKS